MTKRRKTSLPPPTPFNPLDPLSIGTILRERLEQGELHSFPPPSFLGAGLYALYYVGSQIREYLPLAAAFDEEHRHVPVYVGKAAAGNSNYGKDPEYNAKKLYRRILNHANSVREVERFDGNNLRLVDFRVKFLLLDDAWIVLGERALLRAYRPVLWNTIVSGFGSNPPGAARANARSVWDTMHPGRKRAGSLPNRTLTLSEMRVRITEGAEISVMRNETALDDRLVQLKMRKPSVIWELVEKDSPDQRIRVAHEQRFRKEFERLGQEPPEYRLVSPVEIPLDEED